MGDKKEDLVGLNNPQVMGGKEENHQSPKEGLRQEPATLMMMETTMETTLTPNHHAAICHPGMPG